MQTNNHHPSIDNLDSYNQRMSKSVIDKMFFVDKIDVEHLVDFGCADGTLIKSLATLFGDSYVYRGYDVSKEMIEKAELNTSGIKADIRFSDDLPALIEEQKNRSSALVLSSVIHEVYSYSSDREVEEFWDSVWKSGFKFVVIRDMMTSKSTKRQSDSLSVARIKQMFDKRKLDFWESIWGSLHDNHSLVHFLLSYKYEEYEREFKENYLPLSVEDFLPTVPSTYRPVYFDHFTLPFLQRQVHSDFGIQLQDRTHIKAIFRKES